MFFVINWSWWIFLSLPRVVVSVFHLDYPKLRNFPPVSHTILLAIDRFHCRDARSLRMEFDPQSLIQILETYSAKP